MTLTETLIKKWSPLMSTGETPVQGTEMQKTLAQLLENTQRDLVRNGLLTEASAGPAHDGRGSANQGFGGEVASDYGNPAVPRGTPGANNVFYPQLVLPVLRRVYPDLIAHELVSVQAMNQPIGFVAVFRCRLSGLDGWVGNGNGRAINEIGFPPVAVDYTGAPEASATLTALDGTKVSDNPSADSLLGEVMQFTDVAGYPKQATRDLSSGVPEDPKNISGDFGVGADNTPDVQFADIVHGTYPTVTFGYETREVVAKTSKLGAHWSPELAEDMQVMNNINVETEFVNSITYEIGAQIDRQILNEMFKMAIASGNTSTIDVKNLAGIDGPSRTVALLAKINWLANEVAIKTRRGGANFIVASPKVCALISMLGVTKYAASGNSMPSVPSVAVGALQKVGLVNDGQQLLLRDTYARGNYLLLGYKGKQTGESGIVYAPYVPIQISKALRPDSFTNELGARTRYGMVANPLDGGAFYHLAIVKNADFLMEGALQVDNYPNGQH